MIEPLGQLGLKGMVSAFGQAVTTGIRRNRSAMEILTERLKAEAAHLGTLGDAIKSKFTPHGNS
ncbi:hypothetical protein ABAC460_00145 [Asticcacaulis sp. AC460]|uniref:hypothetical protein n=1 Tax=Asticcacaulis sp. AC460 TaxID=1282360 RepID=UPI0003C40412|nr:hypothetical protein [Asticcacaulis sp. AC460]ESQ93511.1 hypothetical protein ABAC460_00145 [Asticcacaulis sp. AC460]